MMIREAKPTEAEKISNLWWDLTKEMEEYSPINEPGEKDDAIEEMTSLYQAMVFNVNYGVFVAIEDEEIIGYIDYEISHNDIMRLENKLLIRQLYVKPDHRNNGTGSNLLDEVIETAKEEDIDHVSVPVEWDNTKAQELYKSKGFDEKQVRLSKIL